jgi:ergothioneine biosynthesis protein EgtB
MPTALPDTELRQSLTSRLTHARAQTDALFALVRPEALHDRPIAERHRILFYIGHLEAFDWNMVARGAFGMDSFRPDFDRLFEFGIDPVDGQLPADQPSDWPPLAEIERYNQRARQAVDTCLDEAEFSDPGSPSVRDGLAFQIAIEHRLMHAETLVYMLHQLPLSRLEARAAIPEPGNRSLNRRRIEIPEGQATLGLERGKDGRTPFGWDNEFDEHLVEVPGFIIDSHDVTNRQFLEFIHQGGYEDRSLWTDPDWEWQTGAGIRHPAFWRRQGGQWRYRTLFAEIPLPLDWPVYVSHAEARAYATWRGMALPTEAQFHRAAHGTPGGEERAYPWGDEPPDERHGNFDFRRWDPTAVGSYPAGDSAFGVADLVGNGWEWTSTLFAPFQGFEPTPLYPRYSANFFDGKHHVQKGGSSRTAACMLRRSFRNWFQPHYPYTYASFRCVDD